MIQLIIVFVGFLGLSYAMSTPEQREAGRRRVKRLEPFCFAVITLGVGFLLFAWIIG